MYRQIKPLTVALASRSGIADAKCPMRSTSLELAPLRLAHAALQHVRVRARVEVKTANSHSQTLQTVLGTNSSVALPLSIRIGQMPQAPMYRKQQIDPVAVRSGVPCAGDPIP